MKTFLLLAIVAFLFPFNCLRSQPNCKVISTHCFSGNTQDNSGNGRHAQALGAQLTSDRHNQNNKAYVFDGTNDKVTIANSNNVYNLNEITAAVWVYLESLPGSEGFYSIFSIGNFGGDLQVLLNNSSRFQLFGFSGGTYNLDNTVHRAITGSMPQTKRWYHLAITRSNTQVQLFVDGQLIGTTTYNNSGVKYSTPTLVNLGARHGNMQYFHGKLDDLRIYDCVKTPSEIRSIYQMNSCGDTCRFTVYDTVKVFDTIRTEIFDTTRITVYDTVVVYDTLEITLNEDYTFGEYEVTLFPNPTQHSVTLDLGQEVMSAQYRLTDARGSLIFDDESINTSRIILELPGEKGVYLLEVSLGSDPTRIFRLIRE